MVQQHKNETSGMYVYIHIYIRRENKWSRGIFVSNIRVLYFILHSFVFTSIVIFKDKTLRPQPN